jgi:hypothetical protein
MQRALAMRRNAAVLDAQLCPRVPVGWSVHQTGNCAVGRMSFRHATMTDHPFLCVGRVKLALRQTVERLAGEVDQRPNATINEQTVGGGARTDWPPGCSFLRAAAPVAAAEGDAGGGLRDDRLP